jgi:transposase
LFLAYVKQILLPTLSPGDLVIVDNLGTHKSRHICDAINSADARLAFLPPYSAALNPIEQMFAKVKHWMRRAQHRTIDAEIAEASDPLGDSLRGRVEPPRTGGRRKEVINNRAHHLLSTERRQAGIVVAVHSVPRRIAVCFATSASPGRAGWATSSGRNEQPPESSHLAGDTAREATSDEVKDLRAEARQLKEALAQATLENRLLKKA